MIGGVLLVALIGFAGGIGGGIGFGLIVMREVDKRTQKMEAQRDA